MIEMDFCPVLSSSPNARSLHPQIREEESLLFFLMIYGMQLNSIRTREREMDWRVSTRSWARNCNDLFNERVTGWSSSSVDTFLLLVWTSVDPFLVQHRYKKNFHQIISQADEPPLNSSVFFVSVDSLVADRCRFPLLLILWSSLSALRWSQTHRCPRVDARFLSSLWTTNWSSRFRCSWSRKPNKKPFTSSLLFVSQWTKTSSIQIDLLFAGSVIRRSIHHIEQAKERDRRDLCATKPPVQDGQCSVLHLADHWKTRIDRRGPGQRQFNVRWRTIGPVYQNQNPVRLNGPFFLL